MTTPTITMHEYRIKANDGKGTKMQAKFKSQHGDIFKATEAFLRRYPGWNVMTISKVKPHARR